MRSLFALISLALISTACALLGETEDLTVEPSKLSEHEQRLLKALAWRGVRKLNLDRYVPFHWQLKRVLRVRKQIVAGTRYEFDVLIARTDCIKVSDQLRIKKHECAVAKNSQQEKCALEVFINTNGVERHTVRQCEEIKIKNIDLQSEEDVQARIFAVDSKMARIMEKTRRVVVEQLDDESTWNMFSSFVERYEKSYDTKQEALKRFQTYKNNLLRTKSFQDNELGTAVYGETQFMDLSTDEFQKIYLPYKWEQPDYYVNQLDEFSPEFDLLDGPIPLSVDWRENNTVTSVKNQESCGSCWAFSVTGNIEGQWAIKSGKLVSLSEQELLDCDIIDKGCEGGLPLNAYKEIIRIGGLEPEAEYPYDAHKERCHVVRKNIAVYINDSIQLPQNENKMAIWLFKNGPISIGINAYPLQFYRHGISHPWKFFCSPMMLNHGVLIVGYGQEGKNPFWIIKNSWGASWGESGYYRLYRGKNVCGVNEMATSAIIH